MNSKPIYISQTDNQQIRRRIPAFADHKRFREAVANLLAELNRAVLVNDHTLSPDVVALDSVVEVADLVSGECELYTLTLPDTANAALNRISVFSPLGTALLGYASGDEFTWQMPGGLRQLRIVTVRQTTGPEPIRA
ncbi:GreA/GreB family elongation factor [Rariglobus hedericola]|uniref:Transcription elongation factor GreAB n=1 Tax=Rariglobus hedericola TaxID=2597822 RepID=A0A556QNP2_9BACT|nr:GreA/GreB family elongation factor [Rariglobus hedericola]TSJ78254.1 transcription elongation factor GreAB [Rariglobus hedericola]